MIDELIHCGIIEPEQVSFFQEAAEALSRRVVFLDSTFVLPNSEENIRQNYTEKHIRDALFFDIGEICDRETFLPHMLPSVSFFEESLSKLGIKNSDILILYGQHGMIMGPSRVWWMFKVFGHHDVLVLNGGLPSWIDSNAPLEYGNISKFPATSYKVQNFEKSRVVSLEEMIELSEKQIYPIIDARPADRFTGQTPEPRKGMRSGSIPGSINIPCSSLIDPDSKKFKDKMVIEQLFLSQNIDLHEAQYIITTCGSGITACALALALFYIGYDNVRVYDGSWSEWGREDSPTRVHKASSE